MVGGCGITLGILLFLMVEFVNLLLPGQVLHQNF